MRDVERLAGQSFRAGVNVGFIRRHTAFRIKTDFEFIRKWNVFGLNSAVERGTLDKFDFREVSE